MRQEKGILGKCHGNKGKASSPLEIAGFNEMDENSHTCPGMKETVMVRDRDGKSVNLQKSLLLSNLKELQAAGRGSHLIRKLHLLHLLPRDQSRCVLIGASGAHTLFVCASTNKILI